MYRVRLYQVKVGFILMIEACATVVSDIVLNVVENQLQEGLSAVSRQKLLKNLKDEVADKIETLICGNDGSILTSQAFGEYLKYDGPVEKIFSSFCESKSEICGVFELTEKLSSECAIRISEKGINIPETEKDLITKFFGIIVEMVYKKIRESSTWGDRATQVQLQDVNYSLAKTFATIEDIQKILKEQHTLSIDQEKRIFEILFKFLCKGKFLEIRELLPLLEEKSTSIKIALTELIELLTKDNVHEDNIAEHIMQIPNTEIRETTIRFIIAYGFLWIECVKKISEKTNNLVLKEISCDLCNKRWEKILLLSEDQKQGNPQLTLLVAKKYPNEEWLSGRTLFWYLNEVHDRLPVNVSEKNIKAPITICDVFLLEQEKVNLYMLPEKTGDLQDEKSRLLSYQEEVGFLGTPLKELYWKSLFQVCRATLDKDTILSCWAGVPSQMKMNPEIQRSLFFAQILDGTVNEQELLGFCISHSDPSELVFYCSKKEDAFVIEFYEKNGRFFADSYFFFQQYILARMRTEQTEGLKSLVEDRITDFEQWIDYWNLYCHFGGEIDFKHLWGELNTGKISGTFYEIIRFGHNLLDHGYLSEAEQLYDKFGKNCGDAPCKMLLARIMLANNKQIEALEQFKDITTEYQSSEFLFVNIIYLSLLNKRPIDVQIIEYAKEIDTPQIWRLLAEYYSEKNQKDQAMQAVTKALLRAKETDIEVYFAYFKMHSQFCCEKEAHHKKRIEADSCVVLHEDETNNECEICIYSDNVVPHQRYDEKPYRWANAFHMTAEEAAENGLCFQEVGEEVTFQGKNYIVNSVKPVDYFLFSQALLKSEEENIIYKISIPELENGELNLNAFFDELKKVIPHEDKLFNKYMQLNQNPFPLFALNQSKNVTYGEFVCTIMKASDVIVRSFECFTMEKTHSTQYVLSFSTEMFFILAGIGADDFVNHTVYIPQSTVQMLEDEYTKTLQDKSRSVVASLGFEGEQPILHKEDSSVRRYYIQEAIKRKNECEKLKSIQNKKSIEVPGADEVQLQSFLGICDYDAISIAHNQGATLVAFEPMVIAMSREDIFGFQCIGIVDFLCKIDLPLHRTLTTMCLMTKYKFQYILSGITLESLANKFDEIQTDEEREKCMILWFEFLDVLNHKDDTTKYGDIFRVGIQMALRECFKGEDASDKRKKLMQNPLIDVTMRLLFNPGATFAENFGEDSEQLSMQS